MPGDRRPRALGDLFRTVVQQQSQTAAKLVELAKGMPEPVKGIEITPSMARLGATVQRFFDQPIGPAEAEPATSRPVEAVAPAAPEQAEVKPPPTPALSAADQAVLDHLMQLTVPVKLDDAMAAARKMGYGRRRFELIWVRVPGDRKLGCRCAQGGEAEARRSIAPGEGRIILTL